MNAHHIQIDVAGMTCDDCERHVSVALERAGATDVTADYRRGVASFQLRAAVAEGALRAAITDAGYTPGRLQHIDTEAPNTAERDADYDLAVLGAGSAAFAAAIKARDAHRRVVLVEAATLGGTCVNVGCVPSKALLRAAEIQWSAGHHRFAGITTSATPPDLAALVSAKDELVAQLRHDKYSDLVDAYGFEVISGRALFTGPHSVEVDGRPLHAGAFLIATGAAPSVPPIPGLADAGYLTSSTALDLQHVPRRLAVIGANAIGLELGQLFVNLGAEVTFFDIAERIAPFEEPEAADALAGALVAQGATIHAPAQLRSAERDGEIRRIHFSRGGRDRTLEADGILVATGRRPNTDNLGLDIAGIATDARGAIVVDDQLRTTNPAVWAAGDVTASPQFVYVSAYEGVLAAENALAGAGRSTDYTGLPRLTFTTPQIAAAGLTEQQAQDAGIDVKTTVLPLSAVPRALVNRDTHGVVKLVADAATDRLVGATIVADGAGDAIQTAVLAIRYGVTTAELAATFHPYLTMVEGLKLAAQTFTRDVARLSCCAA
ncbi:MAG: mercury(II) reductase [Actinomycetota bacterium]